MRKLELPSIIGGGGGNQEAPITTERGKQSETRANQGEGEL